jgi:predicted Zn-ribbon and HTH transcriptional regulator
VTIRQQIMELITDRPRSCRELAAVIRIPEREVEDHLAHIARTTARDRQFRFMLEPAACGHCGFIFRTRTRLTRPSRCPSCRSEDISAPKYHRQARR